MFIYVFNSCMLNIICSQGIDIQDIYIIVQYCAPKSMNTWLQRVGRAVHDLLLLGTAILLAEPTMFDNAKTNNVDMTIGHGQMCTPTAPAVTLAPGSNKENTVLEPIIAAAIRRPVTVTEDGTHFDHSQASDRTQRHCGRPWKNRASVHSTCKCKVANDGQGAVARKKWPKMTNEPAAVYNLYSNEIKVEHAMDDFINAKHRSEKCCRKIACIHFGNINLSKSDRERNS